MAKLQIRKFFKNASDFVILGTKGFMGKIKDVKKDAGLEPNNSPEPALEPDLVMEFQSEELPSAESTIMLSTGFQKISIYGLEAFFDVLAILKSEFQFDMDFQLLAQECRPMFKEVDKLLKMSFSELSYRHEFTEERMNFLFNWMNTVITRDPEPD